MDALSGVQNGTPRLAKHPRDLRDSVGVGTAARRHDGPVIEWIRYFFVKYVVGDLDQHRSRATVAQLRERAAHGLGQQGRIGKLLTQLGEAAEVEVGAEVGGHVREVAWIPARQHENRH